VHIDFGLTSLVSHLLGILYIVAVNTLHLDTGGFRWREGPMGGVSDLLIEIEEEMREIHAEVPRPTWEEAVARLLASEHEGRQGNTFTLGDAPGDDEEGEEGEDGEDGRAWIESVLENVGEQWEDDWEGDVEGDEYEDDTGEASGTVATEQTRASAKIAVGMKRDREPNLGKVIYLVEWRLATQVGSFEDVSHIETSQGGQWWPDRQDPCALVG